MVVDVVLYICAGIWWQDNTDLKTSVNLETRTYLYFFLCINILHGHVSMHALYAPSDLVLWVNAGTW